jgi:hypothetical protein
MDALVYSTATCEHAANAGAENHAAAKMQECAGSMFLEISKDPELANRCGPQSSLPDMKLTKVGPVYL